MTTITECPKCAATGLLRVGDLTACPECWAQWVISKGGEPECSVCRDHITDRTCRCDRRSVTREAAESDARWGMH